MHRCPMPGNLDPKQVSNLDKAIKNAREFTGEVLARLRDADTSARVA